MLDLSKKGFTLVELSIVLVIIGLLIGGILVGQSLIASAKIQTYVRKLQQYEIANEQFVSKYKSMAGDSQYLTPAGNNNKILDGDWSTCLGKYINGENWQVWFHLKQSGTLKSDTIGFQTTSCGGINSTQAQILPVFSQYGGQKNYINYSKGTGVISYYDSITQANTRLYSFALSTIDYLALDEKMDGQKSSKIQASSEWGVPGWWESASPNSANDEVVIIIYSPDRQLNTAEIEAFGCSYDTTCGS